MHRHRSSTSTAEGDLVVEQEEDGDSLDEAVCPTRYETVIMRNASHRRHTQLRDFWVRHSIVIQQDDSLILMLPYFRMELECKHPCEMPQTPRTLPQYGGWEREEGQNGPMRKWDE